MTDRSKNANSLPPSGVLAPRRRQSGKAKRYWCLILVASAAAIFWAVNGGKSNFAATSVERAGEIQAPVPKSPLTLSELLALPTSELEHYDIALLNLLCAQGLPGSEAVSMSECSTTLGRWAVHAKSEIDRHLYHFRNNPAEYEHSEGYFRMLMMSAVVYEDFGIRYNPKRVGLPIMDAANDHFFADSRDLFLHGLIGPRRMGTCSSMPVLYIAIGRRLGYPLKLVTTKSHLFIRWEDDKERFNLEATGRGMNRYGDDHFKHWPFSVTEDEIRTDSYLKSLTRAEELAVFLSLRGNCLKATGRTEKAIAAYTQAVRFAPAANAYRVLLAATQAGRTLYQPPQGRPLPSQTVDAILYEHDMSPIRQIESGLDPNPLRQTR